MACGETILSPHVPKLYLSAYAFGNVLLLNLSTSVSTLSEYPYNHAKDTALEHHCRISNATVLLQKVKWQGKVKKIVIKVCGRKFPKQVPRKTGTRLTDLPRSERVSKFIR